MNRVGIVKAAVIFPQFPSGVLLGCPITAILQLLTAALRSLYLRESLNNQMLRKVPFGRVVGRLRVASSCFLFTIIIIESIQ